MCDEIALESSKLLLISVPGKCQSQHLQLELGKVVFIEVEDFGY